MDIKNLLEIFYNSGVNHEATLNPRYSFEQILANNAQALQLLQPDVSSLLIAWEQYKKANWWESDAVDVEKVLIERFKAIYRY